MAYLDGGSAGHFSVNMKLHSGIQFTSELGDSPVVRSIYLCAMPAGLMMIGALLVYLWKPNKVYVSAMQHLAAGIVLAAVAVELIPKMTEKKNGGAIVGVVIGFCLGVALMIVMRYLFDGDDDDDESDDEQGETDKVTAQKLDEPAPAINIQLSKNSSIVDDETAPLTKAASKNSNNSKRSLKRGNSKRTGAFLGPRYADLVSKHPSNVSLFDVSSAAPSSPNPDKSGAPSNTSLAMPVPRFPVSLLVAVCVDAFTDGLLIGTEF